MKILHLTAASSETVELSAAPGETLEVVCKRESRAKELRHGHWQVHGTSSGGPIDDPAPRHSFAVARQHRAWPIDGPPPDDVSFRMHIPEDAGPDHTYTARFGIHGGQVAADVDHLVVIKVGKNKYV